MNYIATEPKYFNNKVATSGLPGSSNEASLNPENTDSTDIGEPPYSNNDLLQSLPPMPDELEGHEPGTL